MAEDQQQPTELKLDRNNLYKEETFSDLKVGMIKRMTPVKSDGTVDKTRKSVFVAHTSLMTPGGPLPLQAVIQAKDLQQAIKKFPEAMTAAMDRLAEEAKKYQEQQQQDNRIEKPDSRIIVPGR
ncbi:MAG: cytoplasmic protein [Desulfobacterales bacterium]|nr:cytoplasmic protein [Desulfobacterales bacterium]